MESKVGTVNWEPITNGNNLSVFSNQAETVRPRNGEYVYKNISSIFNIDKSGYFEQKDSVMLFKSKENKDTTTIEYKIYGDTLLILNYTSVSPNTEIRYKKIK